MRWLSAVVVVMGGKFVERVQKVGELVGFWDGRTFFELRTGSKQLSRTTANGKFCSLTLSGDVVQVKRQQNTISGGLFLQSPKRQERPSTKVVTWVSMLFRKAYLPSSIASYQLSIWLFGCCAWSPPYFHRCSGRRHHRFTNPAGRWPILQRLNVIVHQHICEHGFQFLCHEKTTGTAWAHVSITHGLKRRPFFGIEKTHQACLPWPKEKCSGLVVTIPILAILSPSSGFLSSSPLASYSSRAREYRNASNLSAASP